MDKKKKTIAIICGGLVVVAVVIAVVAVVLNNNSQSSNNNNSNNSSNNSSAEEKTSGNTNNNQPIADNNASGNSSNSSSNGSSNTDDSNQANSIVGRWQYNDNEMSNANINFIYIFNADGTGEYDAAGSVMKFTYEAKDGKLTIHYENLGDFSTTYEVNGDTLNVRDSGGADTIYKLTR